MTFLMVSVFVHHVLLERFLLKAGANAVIVNPPRMLVQLLPPVSTVKQASIGVP
jgi:hypothetical protein